MMLIMFILLIDGAVTARETNPKHQQLVEEVMTLPSIKVVMSIQIYL